MSEPSAKKLKSTGEEEPPSAGLPSEDCHTAENGKEQRKPRSWTIELKDSGLLPDPSIFVQRRRVGTHQGYPFPFTYESQYDELPQALRRAVCQGDLGYVQKVFEDPNLKRIALSGSRNPATLHHPIDVDPQPPLFSTAPDPGSILVGHRTDWSLSVPLITHACDHGHIDIVKYFIEKGTDINIFTDKRHYVDTDSKGKGAATPLSAACKSGFEDIARMLIERGAILMPMEWKIIRRRSRDEFYGKEVTINFTPFDWVVCNGMHSVLDFMIQHGLLNTASAQFQDKRKLLKKQQKYASELVAHSILCKLLQIWDSMIIVGLRTSSESAEERAASDKSDQLVLETLGQAGFVVAGFMQKIEEETMAPQSWKKRHFNDDGTPEDHVIAIIRGMRYVDLDLMRFVGYRDPENFVARISDPDFKRTHWNEKVAFYRNAATDGVSSWRKPLKDIILLAAEPWSRRNHHLYPVVVRKYVRGLLWFGALLERRTGTSSISKVSLSEIYEDNVVPFIVG